MNGVTGVILAGGQSRRMGRDKALMPLAGRTLIERVMDALMPVCDELLLITNTPDKYAQFGLRMVPDAVPGTGSLGGLYSGLAAMRGDCAIAVACDMPFLNTALLRYCVELSADADAVVPDLSETTQAIGDKAKAKQLDLHPLHAVYRRTCLAPIEAQLQAGDLRMIGFLSKVRVRYVRRADLIRFDPDLHSFFNVNTPAEWAQAEQIAKSHAEARRIKPQG